MSVNLSGQKVGRFEIQRKLGSGVQGDTYLANDDLGGEVAIKFIRTENTDWKQEAEKAVRVRGIEQVVTVFEVGEEIITIEGKEIPLRFIVWEFVEGKPLWDLLKQNRPIPSSLIVDIAEQICYGIKGMQESGLEHGDLHANNIMLVPPKPWMINKKFSVKIVDFGLAKSVRGEKFNEDILYLKRILKECWKRNQFYRGMIVASDKKFQNLLTDLINRMCDPSPERRLKDPIEVVKRIHGIKKESETKEITTRIDLEHPFEYLSVEEMPENSDILHHLYADNATWLKEIRGFGTTVISGPRGSGKSMILKNMRLLTKLRSGSFLEKDLEELNYFGFYVHCQHNLYFPFAGIKFPYDDLTSELFVHYLNLLFTSEILESLILLDDLKMMYITQENKNELIEFLNTNIFQESADFLYIESDHIFSQCKLIIEKEILYTQKKIMLHENIDKRTTVVFIQRFVEKLDSLFDIFKNKRLYFILDDYSNPKIPFHIQKSLNRIISFRNNRFCFKISTEKFGFIPEDMDGKILQQDREFSYVDLGTRYIQAKKSEKKEFIKNILEKRLERAKIKTSAEDFFGQKTYPKKIVDALIHDNQLRDRSSGRFAYSGFDTIYRLCGGDVSTMLQLCKEMYLTAVGDLSIIEKISPKIQDQIIRNFSQKRLEMIKEIPGSGMQLYEMVQSFGSISRKYLYEYEITDAEADFLEVSRLELTENTLCLDDYSNELYHQLVVNTIFVDGGGTYPWGKGTTNVKLILRPIYTPALRISFSDRYSLKIGCNLFQTFLTNPKGFENTGTKFLKMLSKKQSTLFSEGFNVELNKESDMDDNE